MHAKKKIKSSEIARDIRSGMSDAEIMEKYHLSKVGLQTIFRKLIDSRVMTREELEARSTPSEMASDLEKLRELPRNYMVCRIAVSDTLNERLLGHLLDLTEKGLKLIGQGLLIGEVRTLTVQPSDVFPLAPFELEAVCRWSRVEEDAGYVSGMEITRIHEGDLERLRKLIEFNSFTKFDW